MGKHTNKIRMFFWSFLNMFHLVLIADPIGLVQNGVAGKMKKAPVIFVTAPLGLT